MEREESPHSIKEVVIEEYYSKENGVVWYHYRLNGGNWNTEQTSYMEIPWIKVNPNQ